MSLARRGDGQLVINDAKSLSSAGPSTLETVRTMVSHFTRFDGPDGKIRGDVPNAEKLVRDKAVLVGMFQAYAKQDYSSVVYYYARLTPELQKDRLPMLIMLNAAVQMKSDPIPPGIPIKSEEMESKRNSSIKSKVEQYRAAYPNDPAVELAATSFYLNTKQYPQAIGSIDRFDNVIGHDPYLDVMRAQIYLLSGDVEQAARLAEKALTKVPDVSAVYEVAIDAAIPPEKMIGQSRVLNQMHGRFGGRLSDDVKGDPKLLEFLNSPAYREWEKRRKRINTDKGHL